MSLMDQKIYDYRDHVPKSKVFGSCCVCNSCIVVFGYGCVWPPQIRKFKPKDCTAELDVSSHNLFICDNVRFDFMDYDVTTADENVRNYWTDCTHTAWENALVEWFVCVVWVFGSQMFHFWIHTAFIESNYLCFEKASLDKACKVWRAHTQPVLVS
jgi:hypothetical protein